VNFARTERRALCDLLGQTGPDAPTLCTGWTTSDLAAHLVQRERRLDAGLGLLVPPLAWYTERVRTSLIGKFGYPRLVELVREGPPAWSPFKPLDAQANTIEFFVHHEDVRRAAPDWQPRELDPGLEAALWSRLSMAKLVLRRAPAHLALVRPDGETHNLRRGVPEVRVHGPVGELVMWALGRTSGARVEIRGDAAAAARLAAATWRL
jgi:uncharacterized protein (TIGR03085 family)